MQARSAVDYVRNRDLRVQWLLETHVHADHLSAAPYLKQHRAANWRSVIASPWCRTPSASCSTQAAGSPPMAVSSITCSTTATASGRQRAGPRPPHPGHTPACMTYVIGDAAFVGDTCSCRLRHRPLRFSGGDARTLYQSIQKLFTLPDETGCSCAMTTRRRA